MSDIYLYKHGKITPQEYLRRREPLRLSGRSDLSDAHAGRRESCAHDAMIVCCTPVGVHLLARMQEIQERFPRFCARFDVQPTIGNFPWELRLREFYISAARHTQGTLEEDQLAGWAELSPEQQCLTREDCVRLRGAAKY